MGTVVLSLAFGLLVSAAIYFIFFWPAVEPDDDPDGEGDGEGEDSTS